MFFFQLFGLSNDTLLRIINWISIQGLENTNSVASIASIVNVMRVLPYPIFHSLSYHNKTGINIGALECLIISIMTEMSWFDFAFDRLSINYEITTSIITKLEWCKCYFNDQESWDFQTQFYFQVWLHLGYQYGLRD